MPAKKQEPVTQAKEEPTPFDPPDGVLVPFTQNGEAVAIALLAFRDARDLNKPRWIKMTLRAKAGEDDKDVLRRAFMLAEDVEKDPSLPLIWEEHEYGRGGGKQQKEAVKIKDNKFIITEVNKVIRGKDKKFAVFEAYGVQDGQEVSASCMWGPLDGSYTFEDNPANTCGKFPNFFRWEVDKRKGMPAAYEGRLEAEVEYNSQYHNYNIVAINIQENGDIMSNPNGDAL